MGCAPLDSSNSRPTLRSIRAGSSHLLPAIPDGDEERSVDPASMTDGVAPSVIRVGGLQRASESRGRAVSLSQGPHALTLSACSVSRRFHATGTPISFACDEGDQSVPALGPRTRQTAPPL